MRDFLTTCGLLEVDKKKLIDNSALILSAIPPNQEQPVTESKQQKYTMFFTTVSQMDNKLFCFV